MNEPPPPQLSLKLRPCMLCLYLKEVAPKQNFKNAPKSLAERCQFKECRNFADCIEAPQSHPLFSSEKKFGSMTFANEEQKRNLRQKLNIFGFLPCISASECLQDSLGVLLWDKVHKDLV